MKNFMDALAIFYPCTYCAQDFQENIKKSPVRYGASLQTFLEPILYGIYSSDCHSYFFE